MIAFNSLVFRWIAVPWIQSELDKWVIIRNCTAPRSDPKKVLPHGIPELIREKPHKYGALDFKVSRFFRVFRPMSNTYHLGSCPIGLDRTT